MRSRNGVRFFRCRQIALKAVLLSLMLSLPGRVGAQTLSYFGPLNYPVGTTPACVVVGDFNGDSRIDLAVANSGSGDVSILVGNGDGTFKPAQYFSAGGSNPVSIAVGDFNGDGKQDLAVALNVDPGAGVTVLLGNGDGSFQSPIYVTQANYNLYVAAGDFNGDGKLDLAVATFRDTSGVSVFLGNGDGTFQPYTEYANQYPVKSIAVGDLNGDHIPDLVLATGGIGGDSAKSSGAVSVMLGYGDGTFQAPVNYGDSSQEVDFVALGDFDGDGKLDVAAVTTLFDHPEFQPIKTFESFQVLFLGNGDGTLQPALTLNTANWVDAMSIIASDLDGDGKLDMASLVGGISESSLILLQGNGDRSFQTAGFDAETAVSLVAADLNHDEVLDLVWANTATNDIGVLLNSNGVPGFTLTVSSTGSGLGTVVATVVGNPGGIHCDYGYTCSTVFGGGAVITLTAEPADGAAFGGWSGACAGTGSCVVTMNANQSVTATFGAISPPDFSLSASLISPATVSPGGQATSAVTLTALNGFTNSVSLTCSVSPQPAKAPQCSISPSSVAPGTPATLTVTTTGPEPTLAAVGRSRLLYALWLPASGLTFLGMIGVRRSKTRRYVLCLLLFAAFIPLPGCGGSSNNVTQGSPGTPPGSYTITVTGASESTSHGTNVTLNVQ
jgi:FG-GAP-like repeat/Divergent InlB B-repeat domain